MKYIWIKNSIFVNIMFASWSAHHLSIVSREAAAVQSPAERCTALTAVAGGDRKETKEWEVFAGANGGGLFWGHSGTPATPL